MPPEELRQLQHLWVCIRVCLEISLDIVEGDLPSLLRDITQEASSVEQGFNVDTVVRGQMGRYFLCMIRAPFKKEIKVTTLIAWHGKTGEKAIEDMWQRY